jgi:signal transduction histidine kinase
MLPVQPANPRPPDRPPPAGEDRVSPLDPAEAMRFVDRAPDGVVMVDEAGVIRYANQVAREMLGSDTEPLVGSEFGFPLGDSDRPLEIELRGRDGAVRAAEMELTQVGTASGAGWVVAVRDVTGRVEAARGLLEAVQQRDDALAVTSHELRNPLTVLMQASQALADTWEELPAIRRLELLRRINRQIYLINDTVSRVLDAARMDAGLFRPEPQRVPLLDLVLDGLPGLADRPTTLHIDVHERACVEMDPEHAWTVVSNLLVNAATHAPRGPVVVTGSTTGEWTTLVVSDAGPGVPTAERERVFDRYARLDLSSSEGAGLGLWIVKSVVEAYGGQVWCEPNEPSGARFVCRLPSGGHDDRTDHET